MLQKGFSLIELLVVIAIIGILSSIAYPSYQSYICSTYKGQALVALKVCALSLERYYSDGFTYVGAVVDTSANAVCSNQSPAEGQKKFTITLSSVTENSYTLSAIPLAGQTCSNVMQLTADGALTGQ